MNAIMIRASLAGMALAGLFALAAGCGPNGTATDSGRGTEKAAATDKRVDDHSGWWCAEHGIPTARRSVPGGWAVGVDGLELICGDFFAVGAHLGPFDRIWDRAALIAIDPARRAEYTALEKRLLGPAGRILLAGFEYDQSKMQGPPWSLAEADVPGLYAGLDALLLDRYPETDARFADIRPMNHLWLLSARGG